MKHETCDSICLFSIWTSNMQGLITVGLVLFKNFYGRFFWRWHLFCSLPLQLTNPEGWNVWTKAFATLIPIRPGSKSCPCCFRGKRINRDKLKPSSLSYQTDLLGNISFYSHQHSSIVPFFWHYACHCTTDLQILLTLTNSFFLQLARVVGRERSGARVSWNLFMMRSYYLLPRS